MLSQPGELVDLRAGKELWEIGVVWCRILTRAASPRFEVRLVVANGLIAREFFDNEVAAAMYASEQMRVFSTA
jgi:hypothetical protein